MSCHSRASVANLSPQNFGKFTMPNFRDTRNNVLCLTMVAPVFLFSVLGMWTGPFELGKLTIKTGNWEKSKPVENLKLESIHVL